MKNLWIITIIGALASIKGRTLRRWMAIVLVACFGSVALAENASPLGLEVGVATLSQVQKQIGSQTVDTSARQLSKN